MNEVINELTVICFHLYSHIVALSAQSVQLVVVS
jgi:hypothetical protein